MGTLRTGIFSKLSARPTAEERRALSLQIVAIFLVISLLNVLGMCQRALMAVEIKTNLPRLVHSWDGWVWYVWLLAAPVTLLLIRRCKWTSGQVGRSLAATAVGSLAIYFVITNLRYGLRLLPDLWLAPAQRGPFSWKIYFHTETVLLPVDFVTYVGFYAVSFAFDQYLQSRQREEEVLRLQLAGARLHSELARAQRAALARQLQPHFLFNAFNAISSLVRRGEKTGAIQMIAELSELLRMSMECIDEPEVPLRRDLALVRHYLVVERVRFGEKLRFEFDTPEESLDGLVPNLLLQPLVENAVRHGISRRTSPGWIRVKAERADRRLRLSVFDDGPGFGPPQAGNRTVGIGLSNTRIRLESQYGTDFSLEIDSPPGGATRVTVDLPWRAARTAAESRAPAEAAS